MWINSKKPIIALAPMADLTDESFCRVCREVSGNDFVIFREMLSAEAIVRGNEKTLKMGEFSDFERPIVLQLFGGNSEVIVKAAEILVGKRPFDAGKRPFGSACEGLAQGVNAMPSGIDINMGCPVPKIAGKGKAGAYLMKDHETAVEIVKALKKANLGLPITVKTRLGWSKKTDILEFAPKLEQAGADAIEIHGRTKMQGYSGEADWEMIGRAVKTVKIPVIANGDIKNAEDIKKCLEITGAAGVMIGRAALGNPWIFGGLKIEDLRLKISEVKKVVLRHAELHQERYGDLVSFRKHLLCYFKGFDGAKDLRVKLVGIGNLEELKKILRSFKS
jgi:nifR3 family TIM-barrel protein